MLKRLAKNNSEKVKILKVDVSRHQQWANREGIRSIPTFQIYREGEKLKQFSGAPPEAQIQQMIDHYAGKAKLNQESADQKHATTEGAEPTIKPMPKDWLPPGITRGKPE